MTTTAALLPDETRPYPMIRMTLYELIAAISSEVGPADDHLVVAIVVPVLGIGQITCLGSLD